MEPMTIFSRVADPALALRRLRELAPAVVVEGPDDDWRKAVVTVGTWFSKKKVTFTHDPEYYAEPNWSTQMDGMRGYFSRFPKSDGQEKVLRLTTTFRFSLGIIVEPDAATPKDPRIPLVFAVAEALDGVIFTPSAMLDARGRILASAGGEEDPEARWPRVIGEVAYDEFPGHAASLPQSPDTEIATAPDARRVARRALALSAVTVRAILEQGQTKDAAATYRDTLAWIKDLGLEDEFEPNEWKVLQRPLGKFDQRMQIDSTWRLEGLAVLAWSLGRFELPPHDRLVDFNALWESLDFLGEDARTLLETAALRPRHDIGVLRNRLFALHWRLREFHINRKAMDFAKFAETCTFGPLDLTGLPLVDNDLALGGQRLDRAPADAFSTAQSSTHERHLAVNWLWEGPDRYSEASVAT